VVLSGGTALETTVGGGLEIVSSGGIDSGAQIFGGEQDVFGIAGGGTVFGGSQVIEGGGTASNTTIANGGTLVVSAGGLADPTTILGGGLEIISARGSDRGALLSGGEQDVYGNAGGATIFADSQVIESGAAGATPLFRGGGTLDVLSGGSANSARISAGGTEAVSAGATDSGARVSSGAQLVYGFASRTIVFTGAQLVGPGGTASGTTISSGGTEIVNSAGMASGTTISRLRPSPAAVWLNSPAA
jgi:autotransporter passenger strand-loop-strand repeat protein